jgi:hypothetical protein
MGALRLTSRRWALPLRHHADAPHMQRGQDDLAIDTCQTLPPPELAAPAYGRRLGTSRQAPHDYRNTSTLANGGWLAEPALCQPNLDHVAMPAGVYQRDENYLLPHGLRLRGFSGLLRNIISPRSVSRLNDRGRSGSADDWKHFGNAALDATPITTRRAGFQQVSL